MRVVVVAVVVVTAAIAAPEVSIVSRDALLRNWEGRCLW